MAKKTIRGVKIKLASPERIRQISSGEVKKAETINYRTLKPERDGLFCERIFGPTKSYECYCGKYKKTGMRFKGMSCDRCGVELTDSRVRRERMGHIELAAPVVHLWFLRGIPSRLSILLDVQAKELEKVIYFASNRRRENAYKVVMTGKRGDLVKRGDVVTESQKRIFEHYDHRFSAEEAYRVVSVEEPPVKEGSLIPRSKMLEVTRGEHEGLVVEPAFAVVSSSSPSYAVGQILPRSEVERATSEGVELVVEPARVGSEEAYLVTAVARLPFSVGSIISSSEYHLYYNKYMGKFQVQPETKIVEEPCYIVINPSKSPFKQGEIILESESRLCKMFDKEFEAGAGAEAVKKLLMSLDLEEIADSLREAIAESMGQRRRRLIKRLQVVEEFRRSESRPEWMILEVLPVIPPDLRPMVQLDGGRFAVSDINDLYRRVINRNNRLRKLIDMRAPEIVIRNEKRMLQEAVDALIENGRRGKAVLGSANRPLKSLSDLLKGKKGRFRQNLLGKRVDYSGRSVIVIGPHLKHYQCGLPKMMALELFRPFIINKLVEKGYAQNIKAAKRMLERDREEVWEVLEEVIKDHPVLLNRAPTLHRLSIQAFEPVLVEGKAIQIPPLVCVAYNADFDGDQMAVHVPLSIEAQTECRVLMLSANNLLSPANGSPIVTPTQDMVIGLHYLTMEQKGVKGEGKVFADEEDVLIALDHGLVHVGARIKMRYGDQMIETTPGRVLFNSILPRELRFFNKEVSKGDLSELLDKAYDLVTTVELVEILDKMKYLGFRWATQSGLSLGITDVVIPPDKKEIVDRAMEENGKLEESFKKGLISEEEYLQQKEILWSNTARKVGERVLESMETINPLRRMVGSGARGNITQVSQMAGIRGLMADPSGKIIDYPILSNFREGLNMLEYFLSTHGARKGLADTALRTSKSGYLTRRLVDVAQDIIVSQSDCGTDEGIWVSAFEKEGRVVIPLSERIAGRFVLEDVVDPRTGEVLVRRDEMVSREAASAIEAAGVKRVLIRSPMKCRSKVGVCQKCYGMDLARRRLVSIGEAVGVVAAQSIGEPGTQLTMRTFHTGGVRILGEDITQGLPRIEQLFEVRRPKKVAVISEVDGVVKEIKELEDKRKVVVQDRADPSVEKTYVVSKGVGLFVEEGDEVHKGMQISEGYVDPQQLLEVCGLEAVQRYLLDGIQEVYRSQGVKINDKHVEVILRKVAPTNRVRIVDEGDSRFVAGDMVWVDELQEELQRLDAENERFKADNLKVLQGRRIVALYDEEGRQVVGHELAGQTVKSAEMAERLVSSLEGLSELLLEDEEGYVRVIVGESPFRKEVLGLQLMDGLSGPDFEMKPGTLINPSNVLNLLKALKEEVRIIKVKHLKVMEELAGKAYLAEDVVLGGTLLASRDKLLTPEVLKLLADREVPLIRVWKSVEIVNKGDVLEKFLVNNFWGKELGRVIDRDGNEVKDLGMMVDGRVVKEFVEGRIAAMEVGGKPLTRQMILEQALSGLLYGRVLLQDVVSSSGEVLALAGQEINHEILDRIVEAEPSEIVVRGLTSGVEMRMLVQRITFVRRFWKKPQWKPFVHGITKAALSTDSWLSAASFQQTAQVLCRAAVCSQYDPLVGLKENVIIGSLIPAGTGVHAYRRLKVRPRQEEMAAS